MKFYPRGERYGLPISCFCVVRSNTYPLLRELEWPKKNMTRYEKFVGEPWNFDGPDGLNIVLVDFVRKVTISNSRDKEKSYILLKTVTPFQDHGELVKYMIASPRYMGDTVNEILQFGGIVGVARVRQGVSVREDSLLTHENIVYFIIGSLKRLSITNTTEDKNS